VACLNQHGPSAGSSQHVSADKGKDDRNTAKYSVVFSFAGSGSVRASASPRASQQPWRPDVQPSCADGAVDLNAPSEASALATLQVSSSCCKSVKLPVASYGQDPKTRGLGHSLWTTKPTDVDRVSGSRSTINCVYLKMKLLVWTSLLNLVLLAPKPWLRGRRADSARWCGWCGGGVTGCSYAQLPATAYSCARVLQFSGLTNSGAYPIIPANRFSIAEDSL
jgi:hypothetical protein